MASSQRIAANRANASKSTGPRTKTGKAASRRNAQRHGVLATVATINDEERAGFDALLSALDADLKPVGPLEEALVEKIALALWRNRRLARAESATIALQLRDKKITHALWLDGDMRGAITRDDLEPYDPDLEAWLRAVLAEMDAAERSTLADLPSAAPTIHAHLLDEMKDAEFDDLDAYLTTAVDGGLASALQSLDVWCRSELARAARQPERLEVVANLRGRASIARADSQLLFARYQTMLDGQLFRTVRELQALQKLRGEVIELVAPGSASAGSQ